MQKNELKVFDYQNYVDGVFNFPLKHSILEVFGNKRESMRILSYRLMQEKFLFKDVDALGVFVDNHDEARFLNQNRDTVMF